MTDYPTLRYVALSEQITKALGSDDWLIVHNGHDLVTAEDLDKKMGWVGGHCRFRGRSHADCPGSSFGRPCVCPCHKPAEREDDRG